MSEGPIPDTPDKAIQAYLSMLAWIAILEGVSMILHGENYPIAISAVVVGTMLFLAAYKWDALKARINEHLVESLGRTATDARWWIAAMMLAMIVVVFSPYVEQRRWPFTQQQDVSLTPTVVHGPPSAEDIEKATTPIRAELNAAKQRAQNFAAQLTAAQEDAAHARTQLEEFQRQMAAAGRNEFVFSPLPIKKRRLTHAEAAELIDRLSVFFDIFRTLDNELSKANISKFLSPAASADINQRAALSSEIVEALGVFMIAIQKNISDNSLYSAEISEMLGATGAYWVRSTPFFEFSGIIDRYRQAAHQLSTADASCNNIVLIGVAFQDQHAALTRSYQRFDSWRRQIPSRIKELQNEAREDL